MSRSTQVSIDQGTNTYSFLIGNRDWAERLGLKVGERTTYEGEDAMAILRDGYKTDHITDFDYTIAMMLMGLADRLVDSSMNPWDERDYEVKFAEEMRAEFKVTVLYAD